MIIRGSIEQLTDRPALVKEEIEKKRRDKLYKQVMSDLDAARDAFTTGNAVLADIYIQSAKVRALVLIAERLDALC